MKETIVFKTKRFEKMVFIGMLIGIGISTLMFLFVNLDYQFIYMISSLLILSIIIYIFYYYRFEPYILIIDDNLIKISYFNKSFFKKKELSIDFNQLEITGSQNIITLKKQGETLALIRKEAVSLSDWEIIMNRFLK